MSEKVQEIVAETIVTDKIITAAPPLVKGASNLLPTEAPTQLEHARALETKGQRSINHLWETVQAIGALSIIYVNLGLAVYKVVYNSPTQIPDYLSGAMFTVITFYYARTNHTLVGGTGVKDPEKTR